MKTPAKFEMRNIADLKGWENNPRSILEEDFARLKGQISELGVYKTLLVNQDNIVLGGNMRLEAFKKLGIKEVLCGVVETGDEGEMLKYALSDNDQAGITDDLKLAEVYQLHPIDTKLFKIQSNVLRPLESIINPPDAQSLGGGLPDESELDGDLDTYLHGNVKQIVLFYGNEEYQQIVAMLDDLLPALNVDSHTEAITILIREAHARSITDKA